MWVWGVSVRLRVCRASVGLVVGGGGCFVGGRLGQLLLVAGRGCGLGRV